MGAHHMILRRLFATAVLVAVTPSGGQDDPASGSATAGSAPPVTISVPAYRHANTIGVITIRDVIDGITLRSLERRVRRALDDGAEAIVFDLDTPGGRLDATLDITNLIKTDCPANTVAWINPDAYSAGTIIALACREIVVAPASAFGDSAPVSPLGPLPAAERAKAETPLIAEVVDSARRNHYDENLVKSFISVGVELWLIENDRGEQVFVDRAEYNRIFDEEPPADLTPLAPPASAHVVTRSVMPWFEQLTEQMDDGEVPDAAEIAKSIEDQQELPSARRRLSRADKADFHVVKQVISNDSLLVVKPHDAIRYGLATRKIRDDQALMRYFGATTIKRYDRSWSETLARNLMHPVIRGVLLVIFVVCLLIELAAPGLGVFGATSGVALLIFVGAPWLAGIAQWWEILMILAGIVLVAVEIFVTPGLGFAGISGIICLLVGIVGTFVGDIRTPTGQSELAAGITTTLVALCAAGVAGWLIFRQVESLPLFNRLILKTELPAAANPSEGQPGLLEAIGPAGRSLRDGDLGTAETDLRPSGRVAFDGRLVEAKSVGGYIDRGARVRIVSMLEFEITVEVVREQT